MTENPDMWEKPPHGMSPIRFDHCLLYGGDIDGTTDLFTKVLGFRVTEVAKAEDGELRIAIFLSCSTKAHDIALVRHEEDNKFHHCSFQLADWNAIGHAADIMSRYDVSVDIRPTRHGIAVDKQFISGIRRVTEMRYLPVGIHIIRTIRYGFGRRTRQARPSSITKKPSTTRSFPL